MERLSRFILLCLILCLLTGCGGNEGPDAPDTSVSPVPDRASGLSLYDLAGWWERPADYVSEGISAVNHFYISAENATFTVYDGIGNAGESYGIELTGEELTVYMDEPFGEVTFTVSDGMLCDGDGKVHFVPGEEPKAGFSVSDLNGRWLENGTTDYIYSFEGDTYSVWRSDIEMISESGSAAMEEMHMIFSNNSAYSGACIRLDGGLFGTDYLPLEELSVLYDSMGRSFLIREDLAETAEGTALIRKFALIRAGWASEDGDILYLEHNGSLTLLTESGASAAGSWLYDGSSIVLYSEDGGENRFSLPCERLELNGIMYSYREPW